MKKFTSLCALLVAAVATGYAPASHASEYQELGCGADYGPTQQEAPVYPRRAASRGIEGYIIMGFTIEPDGAVSDIKVVDQQPINAFIRTATHAVEGLRFPPCMINGQATRQPSVTIRYNFKLNG